ncbi:MAG: alpha-glycosidase [Erysipelotrichales bacterium]|nr:MAG: alpha-glycosidase [Erysipelotrichales bacterium]
MVQNIDEVTFMNKSAIYHRSQDNWCFPVGNEALELRIRTGLDVVRATCEFGDQHEGERIGMQWTWKSQKIEMKLSGVTALHKFWKCIVSPPHRRMKYHFILSALLETIVYGETSILDPMEILDNFNYFFFPYLHREEVYHAPKWVADTLWYQIFPDRFAKQENETGFKEWHAGPVRNADHYGGNLKGITSKLTYLNALGITGIYLTPIFASPTVHKYDTEDYFKIDPDFGTEEDLVELVKAAHQLGIKVMLDAVFNHAGAKFEKWLDVRKSQKSPYRDWFYLGENDQYETFSFEKNMPKLNTEHPDVIDYFCKVGIYWIEKADIDGWRLDVADEISHTFWRSFRKCVHNVNPEVYILGEVWHDAMPWLQGDQFDAVMNYPYTRILLDLIAHQRISLKDFRFGIDEIFNHYPSVIQANQFNLFDSHDTMRLTTICGNDLSKVKGALAFLYASPGSPCIYYGTEIALEGGNDPDCRRLMQWQPEPDTNDMYRFIKTWILLRKEHPALANHGSWEWINAECIAFRRCNAQECLCFFYNPSDMPLPFDFPKGKILFGERSDVLNPGEILLIKQDV